MRRVQSDDEWVSSGLHELTVDLSALLFTVRAKICSTAAAGVCLAHIRSDVPGRCWNPGISRTLDRRGAFRVRTRPVEMNSRNWLVPPDGLQHEE